MTAPCPVCGGPMRGVAFVDGVRDGRRFGEMRAFCGPCEDAKRPKPTPFGERARRDRIEAQTSLADLGQALNRSPRELSDIERGRAWLSCELAREWAGVLESDPDEYAALAWESLGVRT